MAAGGASGAVAPSARWGQPRGPSRDSEEPDKGHSWLPECETRRISRQNGICDHPIFEGSGIVIFSPLSESWESKVSTTTPSLHLPSPSAVCRSDHLEISSLRDISVYLRSCVDLDSKSLFACREKHRERERERERESAWTCCQHPSMWIYCPPFAGARLGWPSWYVCVYVCVCACVYEIVVMCVRVCVFIYLHIYIYICVCVTGKRQLGQQRRAHRGKELSAELHVPDRSQDVGM
jgi:hypothetical protein